MNGSNKTLKTTPHPAHAVRRALVWGCLVLAVVGLAGAAAARYAVRRTSAPGQAAAASFYFTVDLLGDTKMIPAEGAAAGSYRFDDGSTEGVWQLYGGSRHTLTLQVQNYYDSARIEQKDIAYTMRLSMQDEAGNALTIPGAVEQPTLTNSSTNTAEAGYILPGAAQSADTLTLTIPPYDRWNYPQGAVITVEIASSRPYEKTLKLHFQLFATDATLQYRIIDTEGSPYAKLVLMTNVESGGGTASVKPYIRWPEVLAIDNTNSLTFTRAADGSFVQQPGMTERNMQISEDLFTGRSEAIYFFKSDPQKNYSVDDTVVPPVTLSEGGDTAYIIDLTGLALR